VQLDLRAANKWQLTNAGVPETQIAISDLCTGCRPDLLFSYRREGAGAERAEARNSAAEAPRSGSRGTGRMMAAIGIREKK
jgi:copper oxidase (laccase) domain-containing protein